MSSSDDYYLGLDMGTDSLGWAVTDRDYNVLRVRGHPAIGTHRFESGKTAEERRMHRTSRRRLERRKQRINLLDEIFDKEMTRIDPGFFQKLDESRLYGEERTVAGNFTLFNDDGLTDVEYHKRYPTIYHLRKYLMEANEKPDIRLVYLAIHHIIKYRGHFLFDLAGDGDTPNFECLYSEFATQVSDLFNIDIYSPEIRDKIKNILLDKDSNITQKKKELERIIPDVTVQVAQLIAILAGGKAHADKLFADSYVKDVEIDFRNTKFEDVHDEIIEAVGEENMLFLDVVKALFDWAILTRLLDGKSSISAAMVRQYDTHRKDLVQLKAAVKRFHPERYYAIFKSNLEKANYCAYVGVYKKKSRAAEVKNRCSHEDFCKFVLGEIENDIKGKPEYEDMLARLKDSSFLPKQRTRDNAVIPNALHRKELRAIVDNMSRFYPFLSEKDGSDISNGEKIVSLCTFRIPYYVGPLNSASERAWATRRGQGRITPWNFGNMVDGDASARDFIERMTSFCTYLRGEKVLPKHSLAYSEFMLYNELNKVKINGESLSKISLELKEKVIRDLFRDISKPGKVTEKIFRNYLKQQGLLSPDDVITGFDQSIKTNTSYVQLKGIIGGKVEDKALSEGIIRCITLFGEDRNRVQKLLSEEFAGKLGKDEVQKLSHLKFEGWGRFSDRFLNGITCEVYGDDVPSGGEMTILEALRVTDLNLVQLLSDRFGFQSEIDRINGEGYTEGSPTYENLVEDLYASPAVKRSIWRTVRVVQDIEKAFGRPPSRIFVETTRSEGEKKPTISRKKELVDLYKNCQADETDWTAQIEDRTDGELRGKKLFSYYLQQGRCMYCYKRIDLNDLEDLYEMDHIIPQSKKVDDSIRDNLVLVCKQCNQNKGDTYPIRSEIQSVMGTFWKRLKDSKFITDEKYSRLVRKKELSYEELGGFVAIQLVKTSQAVKGTISVLKRICPIRTSYLSRVAT